MNFSASSYREEMRKPVSTRIGISRESFVLTPGDKISLACTRIMGRRVAINVIETKFCYFVAWFINAQISLPLMQIVGFAWSGNLWRQTEVKRSFLQISNQLRARWIYAPRHSDACARISDSKSFFINQGSISRLTPSKYGRPWWLVHSRLAFGVISTFGLRTTLCAKQLLDCFLITV